MKKPQLGLVVEGNSTSSTLLRLSSVISGLGPIKSLGLQVASRVSNFINGGYAVSSYSELEPAQIVLIRVPDDALERTVSDLCQSGLSFTDRCFVLCESWAPTEMLQPLRMRGAHVASIVSLPCGPEKTFALEGDVRAVRPMRRIIERCDLKALELQPGCKHLLFAAVLLCSAVPVPALLLAQKALRDSGISGNQLSGVFQQMSGEMLSAVLRGARQTWGGPLAECTGSHQDMYWRKLHHDDADLARHLTDLVAWSQTYMSGR